MSGRGLIDFVKDWLCQGLTTLIIDFCIVRVYSISNCKHFALPGTPKKFDFFKNFWSKFMQVENIQ